MNRIVCHHFRDLKQCIISPYSILRNAGPSKILPASSRRSVPIMEPSLRSKIISLPSLNASCPCYTIPELTNIQDFYLPISNHSWIISDHDFDMEERQDSFIPTGILPKTEISDPDLQPEKSILCKMHQGRNVKRLRRIRMRRHRYVKWLKRMRFKLRKLRFEREKKKAKAFQDHLDGIVKTAENFDGEEYIKSQVDLARKGGYSYDIRTELKHLLTNTKT